MIYSKACLKAEYQVSILMIDIAEPILMFLDTLSLGTSALASSYVHRIMCRFLIDKDLSKDPDFLAKSSHFISSIFWNAYIIKSLPLGPFRDLLTWPLSYFHRRNLDAPLQLLEPAVRRRIANLQAAIEHVNGHDGQANGKANGTIASETHFDAVKSSLSASVTDTAKPDPRQVSLELLHNLWIGSKPTGFLLANALNELRRRPAYLEPLRVEAQEAVGKFGWSEDAIQRMPLLNNFIRHVGIAYPFSSSKACFFHLIHCPRSLPSIFPLLANIYHLSFIHVKTCQMKYLLINNANPCCSIE